jgi:hypothetical protein
MTNDSATHDDSRAKAVRLSIISSVLACVLVSLVLRLIHYRQSLWGDEMNALLEYIIGPWSKIVAPAAGEYVPNDHVLFTILARLCFEIGGGASSALGSPMVAGLIRLPSLIAGTLVPIALAWPMRRKAPLLAILIAIFAAVNPWLIAFSDEARGYSLMILLGIIATNLLPDGRRRWPIGYALAMMASIYTVPVAGVLLIAHFLVVIFLRPSAIGVLLRGTLLIAFLSIFLLLPMARGLAFYYEHPMRTSSDLEDLANQLPRFALAGQYIPSRTDPLLHNPDPYQGVVYWLLPVLVLIIGSKLGWKKAELKEPLAVMATATLLVFLIGLINPDSTQVRFVPWCALWLILSTASSVIWLQRRWGNPAALLAIVVLASWFVFRDVDLLPSQPIREAMVQADVAAPPRMEIVMALLTAADSARIYADRTVHQHVLTVASGPGDFVVAERAAIEKTGRRPWVILSYEYMPHDFSPRFWDYFLAHYELQNRLSGRISPVGIYKPRAG